jgi:hypothetical protein
MEAQTRVIAKTQMRVTAAQAEATAGAMEA